MKYISLIIVAFILGKYSSLSENIKTHLLTDTVVVTADRQTKNILETNASIVTISPYTLNMLQPSSTPESMLTTNGVFMQKTNHGGGSPFIRGVTGQQVLILIDGIRLNNSTTRYGPNQYLNTVDVNFINKIEILKGQGSVEFGSDAIGGTINILNDKPHTILKNKGQVLEISGKYISNDMEKSINTKFGYLINNIGFIGSFGYSDFGDVFAGGNTGKQSPSGYSQFNGNFSMQYKIDENKDVTIFSQITKQDNVPLYHKIKLENFEYNHFDPQLRNLNYISFNSNTENNFFNNYSLKLFNINNLEGRISKKNNSNERREEKDDIKTYGFNFQINSILINHLWTMNSGVETYYDKVKSERIDYDLKNNTKKEKRGLYPDNSTYNNIAIYNLHNFKFKSWIFDLGWRFDNFNLLIPSNNLGDFNIQTNALVWKVGISNRITQNQLLGLNINKAFRAPNIDDMGTLGIVDFRYEVPSNDLKPESSINYELIYKYFNQDLLLELSLYRNNLSDFIQRERGSINGKDSIDGYPVYVKKNLSEAYIEGIELSMKYLLFNNLMLESQISYTYGQNITKNEPIRRIPPLNGLIAAEYYLNDDLILRSEFLFADKQDRLAQGDKDDNRIPDGGTPGWEIINMYLKYRYKFIQGNLILLNIFNEDYRYHGSGINMYGRSIKLNLNFSIL